MPAIIPAYAKPTVPPNIGKTLTDAEYASLLDLIFKSGYEPLTDTDGNIITHTSGEILYGKI